ncbi:hypothetical protein VNO77_19336 [Canavalia gladiata]|uniref:Uncharacterized protein n=1 Tax=Canavalia gladiata TaxID=3824 RepID=A0AAN9LSD9_CANGL
MALVIKGNTTTQGESLAHDEYLVHVSLNVEAWDPPRIAWPCHYIVDSSKGLYMVSHLAPLLWILGGLWSLISERSKRVCSLSPKTNWAAGNAAVSDNRVSVAACPSLDLVYRTRIAIVHRSLGRLDGGLEKVAWELIGLKAARGLGGSQWLCPNGSQRGCGLLAGLWFGGLRSVHIASPLWARGVHVGMQALAM